MVKKTIEGIQILPSPPTHQSTHKAPVVYLDDGLALDDRIFECPTLLVGPVGSGKSFLFQKMMAPILQNAAQMNENMFIFCAKKDLLRFKRPQDIVISVDATVPEACWNIIKEVAVSKKSELTARDIAKSLTRDQHSDMKTPKTTCSITQLWLYTRMD